MNDYIEDLLKNHKLFKIICGTGNEFPKEIEYISYIYTLAGANMIDISADTESIKSCIRGIKKANVEKKPIINVSIGIKGDPHIRKIIINKDLCINCGECKRVCNQKAITQNIKVISKRCIGCGICYGACKIGAISFYDNLKDYKKILPKFLKMGVETFELHASTTDIESSLEKLEYLNSLTPNNFIGLCLDRTVLSNSQIYDIVKKSYNLIGDRLIIQADGVPMSGTDDTYNTTLQTVACADIIRKSKIPVYIILSGGTNSKTISLSKLCNVEYNGISIGSWARKIVRESKNKEEALSLAKELVNYGIN